MSEKTILSITTLIKGSIASSTEDGEVVFHSIDSEFKKEKDVWLNFEGTELIVSTFLNAAIGQLYGFYPQEYIKEHLKVVNMTNEDLKLLQKVIERAKQYFADKDGFGKTLNNSLEDE